MVHETRGSNEFTGGTEGMDVPGDTGRADMRAPGTRVRVVVCTTTLLSNTFTLPDISWGPGKTSSDYFLLFYTSIRNIAMIDELSDRLTSGWWRREFLILCMKPCANVLVSLLSID